MTTIELSHVSRWYGNVVAVNDITDNATLAHLLRYDTAYGRYPSTVESNDDGLMVDGTPDPLRFANTIGPVISTARSGVCASPRRSPTREARNGPNCSSEVTTASGRRRACRRTTRSTKASASKVKRRALSGKLKRSKPSKRNSNRSR